MIHLLHPLYYSKIVEDILKIYKKQVHLFKLSYMINGNENEVDNEK